MNYLRPWLFFNSLLILNILFATNAFSISINAPFTTLVSTDTTPNVVIIAADDPNMTDYSWTVDGSILTDSKSEISTTFTTLGVHTVLLTVTNGMVTESTFFDINVVASAAELVPQVMITTNTISTAVATGQAPAFFTNEVIVFNAAQVSDIDPIFNQTDATKQRFLWYLGDPASNVDVTNMNLQVAPDVTVKTASFQYNSAGHYTVTLVAQDNYVAGGSNALSGVATMEVEVIAPPPVPNAPPVTATTIQQIYIDRCLRCHGTDGANGIQKPIAGRLADGVFGPAITADVILASYDAFALMASSRPRLTRAEAEAMTIYLGSLQPQIPPVDPVEAGMISYIDRCSVCHGRGLGGFAGDIMPGTLPVDNAGKIEAITITNAILNNQFMNTIVFKEGELDSLLVFMNGPGDGNGAYLAQPTTGTGLYTMYCSYCHGDNGLGGAIADFPIKGVGTSASQINEALEDDDEMEALFKNNVLSPNDVELIADTL